MAISTEAGKDPKVQKRGAAGVPLGAAAAAGPAVECLPSATVPEDGALAFTAPGFCSCGTPEKCFPSGSVRCLELCCFRGPGQARDVDAREAAAAVAVRTFSEVPSARASPCFDFGRVCSTRSISNGFRVFLSISSPLRPRVEHNVKRKCEMEDQEGGRDKVVWLSWFRGSVPQQAIPNTDGELSYF